jgi:hypothetical protein
VRCAIIVLLLSLTVILPVDVRAEFSVELSKGEYQHVDGELEYETHDENGRSILKFPLDTNMGGLRMEGQLPSPFYYPREENPDLRWGFSGLVAETGERTGKGEDIDYIKGDGHSGIDIYSEANTILTEGIVTDGWLEAVVERTPSLMWTLRGGLRYERFSFENHDVQQDGRGPYDPAFDSSGDGLSVSYDRKTYLPYWGVRFRMPRTGSLQWQLTFYNTGFMEVRDEDNHHERNKLSTGEMSQGVAYIGRTHLQWHFTQSMSLDGGIEYNYYEAEGTQRQEWYGDDPTTAGDDTGKTVTTNEDVKDEKLSYRLVFIYLF